MEKETGMNRFSDFNLQKQDSKVTIHDGKRFFNATLVNCGYLVDKPLIVNDFEDNCKTAHGNNRMFVFVNENGHDYKYCTNNPEMKQTLRDIKEKGGLPFETIIKMDVLSGGIKHYFFT